MLVISRKVDEAIVIGQAILVTPTDIDAKIVRLTVRGRMLGGPDDGANFQSVHELAIGQSFPLGTTVRITLLAIGNGAARIGITHPPSLMVLPKESLNPSDKIDHGEAGLDD